MNQNISLLWHNLTVDVPVKSESLFWSSTRQKKTILNNVSGVAYSNSLIAIMGPSGSGKTTFLGALSGRLKDSSKSGSVKINNCDISSGDMKKISGYVHQKDIFTETLTTMEHLKFLAALQLSKKTKEYRRTVVTTLISELSLETHKNTVIKNLSGGERRRLSLAGEVIAGFEPFNLVIKFQNWIKNNDVTAVAVFYAVLCIQLIRDPSILFCDEPTTGLDSYSAINVVEKLQAVASTGKLILMTIHQPSSQLFNYFHTIVLLAAGKLVFQGSRDEAKSFFDSIEMHCPQAYNPADFYIKCLTISEDHIPVDDKISAMSAIFKLKRGEFQKVESKKEPLTWEKTKSTASCFCQLKWLLWRSMIDMQRNMMTHFLGYCMFMITGLVLSVSYAFVSVTDPNSVQNIQGILFFIVSELTFANMYSVIYVFPAEMPILLKEKSLYSSFPYFISKLISLIPYCLVSSGSYMILFFLFVNFLKGFRLFLNMSYVMFCTAMASAGIGLAFSATFNSIEYIDLIMGPLELLFMLLSGLWIKIETVSPVFSWVRYISPFFLAFESLSMLHWSKVETLGPCIKNDTAPCFNDGNQVLESYGFLKDYESVTYNVVYLHVLIVLYCLIGFAGILRKRFFYSSY